MNAQEVISYHAGRARNCNKVMLMARGYLDKESELQYRELRDKHMQMARTIKDLYLVAESYAAMEDYYF